MQCTKNMSELPITAPIGHPCPLEGASQSQGVYSFVPGSLFGNILFQDVGSPLSTLIFGCRACLEPVSFLYDFKPLFMFSAIRLEAYGKQGLC